MRRLLVSLAIAIPISVVVGVVLFFAAAFAGAAGHSMTPQSVLFPYGTFVVMRTSFETAGMLLVLLQFPFYGIIIAVLQGPRRRTIAVIVIVSVHLIAAVGAVKMYQWW